ncbi:MAG: glycosyltransferase [Thermoanaerobaculales bacterium]|nr:glycosyltransferase [Thermoanaerobaculales bacterium]
MNPPETTISDPSGDRGSSSADRSIAALEQQVRRLEFERDGYYAEWQHAKNQLEEIHRSRMWKLWMASIELRRPWRNPGSLLKRGSGGILGAVLLLAKWLILLPFLVLRGVFRGLGWLFARAARGVGWVFLALWCAGARLTARLRPHRRPEERAAGEPTTALAADGRPLRVLLVMPYHIHPPDHGGGVRLFNLVRELGSRCDLYLLVFSQAGEDPEQREVLEQLCRRVDFHPWRPRLDPDRFGLVPPNAQLFASDRASAKIRDIVRGHDIDLVQLEYTELAQYREAVPEGVPVILTEHDVAFRSFARRRALGFHRRFPEGGAFGTSAADARRLMHYEIASCRAVDQIHTMSVDDAEYLAGFLGDGADRMVVAPNGVDTGYYAPPEPPPERAHVLYVGNYQNLPNVDALEYFVLDVWPLLRLRRPDARLSVVGANPSERVLRFDGRDGIEVVGPVDDLRDAYHGHRVMVAPIRAGSGTRLKILEAFAAGIPVVSTTLAAEGIGAVHERHLLIADNAVDFADGVVRVLDDDELATDMAQNAMDLVTTTYDWKRVAAAILDAYRDMVPGAVAGEPEPLPASELRVESGDRPEISIVIPTLNGGEDLGRCLEAIRNQDTGRTLEVLCVDSGSPTADLATMERFGARLVSIDRADFNHGLTRDLGARHSTAPVIAYLNQDAVPAHRRWLEELIAPFDDDGGTLAGVQGGMAEAPDPSQRWFWDSCGQRFYFTSESDSWIADHDGIGFSTVNCAISRRVWERHPFGWAPIMEDKKWQREVTEAGFELAMQPDALVHHTHLYPMRSLLRRCVSEGYGWRTLGERYTFSAMASDMAHRRTLRELASGLRQRRIRSSSELLFPWLRPAALYWGNRFSQGVKL